MPIAVKIIEWEPGLEIPLHELDREMFDIPPVGAPYWRENGAMRVRDVEEGDPVRVHLERDPDRERRVIAGLPDGCTIDCGRNSDTGAWNAIVEKDGRIIATATGDECDTVVRDAIGHTTARG